MHSNNDIRGMNNMISEYWEELQHRTPHINLKQVKYFEEYLTENNIPQYQWIEAVREYYDNSSYAKTTRKNYKYGMRIYLENILHKKKTEEIQDTTPDKNYTLDETYTKKQLQRIEKNLKKIDEILEPELDTFLKMKLISTRKIDKVYSLVNDSRVRIDGIRHKCDKDDKLPVPEPPVTHIIDGFK